MVSKSMGSNENTAIRLCAFQKDWIADRSRFKISVKARRVGFTFASTLEIALDLTDRRTRWLIISRTQDTAKEAMREVKNHFGAMREAVTGPAEIQERPTDLFFDGMRANSFVITLPNGSDVTALTAHPDAARGFGGNILLDEFGFHRDSYELWKGASAAVLRGHRLIVVSTPHYQLGKYYDLARECDLVGGRTFTGAREKGIWSRHWVDINLAAPQLQAIGVPLNLDELKKLAGDDDAYQQEYCCQFLSAAEMWISLELIASARSPQATLDWNPAGASRPDPLPTGGRALPSAEPYTGWLYVGADIGRKRDRTAIWIDERIADVAICRGMISLDRMSFELQYETFCEVLSHPRVRRCCIDATGIGAGLAERLQERFVSKVEGVTFTGEAKEDMAIRVRRRMEEKLDKIPMNAPEIERDFAAIKRETTASGNLRFDAARTDAGHADIFWAKALADLAADSGVPAACFSSEDYQPEQPRSMFNPAMPDFGDNRPYPSIWAPDRVLEKGHYFEQ